VNILFLTENFPPETNAAATRVYERAAYWVRWGQQVSVVTCAPNFPVGKVFPGYRNGWYRREIVDGIRVGRVKTFVAANEGFFLRTLDFLSFMVSGGVAGLFGPRPDVVVATSPQFFAAVAGWGVAGLRRRPFLFELSDLWPSNIVDLGVMKRNLLYRGLERLELFLYRRSAAVVALTRAFKEDLTRRGVGPEKIAVVINGVDLPRYRRRERNEALAQQHGLSQSFVVGYVGTHGLAHELENVLAAADSLRVHPRIRFLFVGAGARREALMREALQRKLPNTVFVPPQPKEAMPDYWSLCDVALVHLKNLPTYATVIPSKMFEAMGMGLPLLLVAPEGEAQRILGESGSGRWVPAGRPDLLAAAVEEWAEQPDLVRQYATGSEAAAPRYSRERQARDFLTVLEGAVRGARAVPVELQ